MAATLSDQTVGQLVRERPARARLFEQLQIDYCCGGKVPLSEACRKRDLPIDEVVQRLRTSDAEQADSDQHDDPDAMPLDVLADHLESTHHRYLREELPRLEQLAEKVARVHASEDPRLLEVDEALAGFVAEIFPHLDKEETILFPAVREIVRGGESPQLRKTIAEAVAEMEDEHDGAGEALSRMRDATDGFAPPAWACNTYRALLDGLAQLERDTHQHVHKENNVLHPKVLAIYSESVSS